MKQDSKISELTEQTYSTIEAITGLQGKIMVPVCIGNANLYIDLKTIVTLLLSYLTAQIGSLPNNNDLIANIANRLGYRADTNLENSGSNQGNQGSSNQSSDYTALANRVTALESGVSSIQSDLTNPTLWPLHHITVTDGTNNNSYVLPTHKGGTGAILELQSTSVAKPLFYVELSLNQPQINNNVLSGGILVRIKGKDAANNELTGGELTKVEIGIDYYYSGSTYLLWNGSYQEVLIDNGSTTITPNSFAEYNVDLSEIILQSSATSITAKLKINNRVDSIVLVSTGLGGSNTSSALINPPLTL